MGIPRESEVAGLADAADVLDVRVERAGGLAVVRLAGDLHFGTAGRLREGAGGPAVVECPRVVVDVGDVSFFDSAGWRALLWVWRAVRARGGRLVLARVPPRARWVLGRMGVGGDLEMADSVAGAVAALSG